MLRLNRYNYQILLTFLLCLPLGGEAETTQADPPSYGEIMLIEKQDEIRRPWRLEFSGMQEFSNPYLEIQGISVSAKRGFGDFIFIGPEFTKYYAEASEVNETVTNSLRSDSISQVVFKPKSAIYGVVSVIPVAGHLNLFNSSSVPFEFEVSIGYGSVQYEGQGSEGAFLWRIGPRAFVTDAIGVHFQFGQEIESPFGGDQVTRSQAKIGIVTRF